MTSPTQILIVEDNPVDVRVVCFALEEEKSWSTQTAVADNGEKAIEYLLGASNVDLVILDLNLPKRDGIEVLKVIRSSETLASLPVIVLSSSPEDISESRVKALNLSANGYIRKPVGVTEFTQLGQRIRECYKPKARSAT